MKTRCFRIVRTKVQIETLRKRRNTQHELCRWTTTKRITDDLSKTWNLIAQLHSTWHEWSRWATTWTNPGWQYSALGHRITLEHQTTLDWIRCCKYSMFLFHGTQCFSNPAQKWPVGKLVSSCVMAAATCMLITSSPNLHITNTKHIASKHNQHQTNWHMTRSSQRYKHPE